MFCPNCGTSNDPGARFCANCGQPLFAETIVPPQKKQIDSRVAVGILIAVVAAIVAVLALCAYVKGQNSPEKLIIGEWEAEETIPMFHDGGGWTRTYDAVLTMKFTEFKTIWTFTVNNCPIHEEDCSESDNCKYEIDDETITLYDSDGEELQKFEFYFIDDDTFVLIEDEEYEMEFTRIGY